MEMVEEVTLGHEIDEAEALRPVEEAAAAKPKEEDPRPVEEAAAAKPKEEAPRPVDEAATAKPEEVEVKKLNAREERMRIREEHRNRLRERKGLPPVEKPAAKSEPKAEEKPWQTIRHTVENVNIALLRCGGGRKTIDDIAEVPYRVLDSGYKKEFLYYSHVAVARAPSVAVMHRDHPTADKERFNTVVAVSQTESDRLNVRFIYVP